MDWDKLRIFHSVAAQGSLTRAGDSLHLSQSAVSRQISALEEMLHVTLFHRHARGLILTEQGELLYETTIQMSKRLEATTARIRDSEDAVLGELRVTTTTGFGTLWLAPRLPSLYHAHPGLEIDLMLEERVLDLPMREADVAIRMKEPSQADLIRKRLMQIRMRLYATPQYLAEHGTPTSLADFDQHRLICQHANTPQVQAGGEMVRQIMAYHPRSTFKVNNYFGVLQGVINHLGIGVLPDYITEEFPNLCSVMQEAQSAEVPVFLAYPEELRHSKRVAAFRDFIDAEILAYRKGRKGAPQKIPPPNSPKPPAA